MTRTSGSVPDGRVDARALSTPGTLRRVCGSRCTTPARSASFWPVARTRAASWRAVSTPSPVVA
ncbi:Uncharacterised protein [Mycobacteroides abscessus]|nr:Uncharacterised protein [Mycobacteroides abscessus]